MSTSSMLPLRVYYCKSGYYLKIDEDGEVGGADHSRDKNASFEVNTVTYGVITLKAIRSEMYLAVDDKGKIHGQVQLDESCEFIEKFDPSGHYTVFQPRRFASQGWHVGLGRHGQARPAYKIKHDQKCAHFIPRAVGGGGGSSSGGQGAAGLEGELDLDFLEELGFTSVTGLGS